MARSPEETNVAARIWIAAGTGGYVHSTTANGRALPGHPEDESFPGLLLLKPEGPIFFANAAQIAHKIDPLIKEAQPRIVAVDASGVLDLEYTALKMFAQFAERQSQHGVQLWLIGMNPEVLAVVQRSPLGQMLRRGGMYFNLEIAISNFLATAGDNSEAVPRSS